MNETELLAAVSQALQRIPTGDGMTVVEIAKTLNLSEAATRKALRQLSNRDQLVCIRVWRLNITGCSQRVPGYQLKVPPPS